MAAIVYEHQKAEPSQAQLEQAYAEIGRLRAALFQIKSRCAGDRAPYWTDDWQTTHSRGVILDLCDAALTPKRT